MFAAGGLIVPSAPAGHVNDYAHSLSTTTAQSLEQLLTAHENATTNQVVVVTVPSLQGQDIADVTYAIGNAWGIGKKHTDNGVIYLIAPSERKQRIEVGKGLEGALTDLQTQSIQQDLAIPEFRAGNFDQGILKATTAIIQAIQGEYRAPAAAATAAAPQNQKMPWYGWLVIAVLVILFISFPRAGMLLLFSGFGGRGGGGGGGFSGGGGSFGGGGSSSSW